MNFKAAVLTVSDKGASGLRTDTSGPAVCALLREHGWEVVFTTVIPDEYQQIRDTLIACTDEMHIPLILTTGGTGFSPRDVTPEATLSVVERETPGIPEAMRMESMRITPRGCLSRSAAGIRKRSLIVNLPGSEKAAKENLLAVLDPISHGIEMLLGEGSADCAQNHRHKHRQVVPSIDQWLDAAKKDPSCSKAGMYLTHVGVVRTTSKAVVRNGATNVPPVTGMILTCDRSELEQAITSAREAEGICYVRVWVNEGKLDVGDTIMCILMGGDTRPHTTEALNILIDKIKSRCVREQELFEQNTVL